MTSDSAGMAQERDWIARLMAAGPAGPFGEGARLARGIVHPRSYQRAAAEGEPKWHRDAGWRTLYRIMLMTIEQWCQDHLEEARRAVRHMTFEDMLWLFYKEKWGEMCWEIRAKKQTPEGLTRTVLRTAWLLEAASAEICQSCGAPSSVRAEFRGPPGEESMYGWVNTLCDTCHRSWREERREEAERRWGGDRSDWRAPSEPPPSRAETEVEVEQYLTRLRPFDEDDRRWRYAHDVLEEWERRESAGRKWGNGSKAPFPVECTPAPAAPETAEHTVRLGRWRYEEAVVEINAGEPEEAAGRAREAELTWTPTERTSEPFVHQVHGSETHTVRTALRIEERHGETATLEAALAERKEASRAAARRTMEESATQ